MNTAKEVRDDFLNAINAAIEDEEFFSPTRSVAAEGDSALLIVYRNGKRFRISFEEVER
jgi:hypothetical protein